MTPLTGFLYATANVALHGLHLGIITFTMVGWMFCSTRPAHLLLLALIVVSWIGLGSVFGYGYCVITDVQWRLRARMGLPNEPGGYVRYLIRKFARQDVADRPIDLCIYAITGFCVAASLTLTFINDSCNSG